MAGRPKVSIDWNQVNSLLEAGCLTTEIAAYFNIHRDTLYDRCLKDNDCDFPTYSTKKKERGESLLRVSQYKNAMSGNTTMQIWLGKQRLGQKENKEAETLDAKLDRIEQAIKEQEFLSQSTKIERSPLEDE